MNRLFQLLLMAAIAAGLARAAAAGESPQGAPSMLKAVIHINFADAERHDDAVRNVENILKDVPDAEIVVVCHSGGIGLVLKDQTGHAAQLRSLMDQGVRFVACQNTLKRKKLTEDQLVPGVSTVPSGAVEILRKQQQGFGYFKP